MWQSVSVCARVLVLRTNCVHAFLTLPSSTVLCAYRPVSGQRGSSPVLLLLHGHELLHGGELSYHHKKVITVQFLF